MTENEFMTSYTNADRETQKQVRQLLGLEPEKTDIYFDLLLIGYQSIEPIVEHTEQLQKLMDKGKFDALIDAYLLGIMHGVRKERTRKKARCR